MCVCVCVCVELLLWMIMYVCGWDESLECCELWLLMGFQRKFETFSFMYFWYFKRVIFGLLAKLMPLFLLPLFLLFTSLYASDQ